MRETSRPSSIDEIKAELKRPKRHKSLKQLKRKISTDSIEAALDQIIRARTAGAKASIKPAFVAQILKELIDYRYEEKQLAAEVEHVLSENSDKFIIRIEDVPKIRAEEVMSLSELGNSSWETKTDLHKIEWQRQGDIEVAPEGSDEEIDEITEEDLEPAADSEDLDEDDVVHEVYKRPVAPSSKTGGHHVSDRWDDGSSSRRRIIFTLLTIIALTFGSLCI